MLTIPIIIYVILIVFAILQVILFFKLWGACNNIAEINHKLQKTEKCDSVVDAIKTDGHAIRSGAALIGGEMIPYTIYDKGYVVFKDNEKARVKDCSGTRMALLTYDGRELVYQNEDSAMRAAYIYATEGKVSSANLVEEK